MPASAPAIPAAMASTAAASSGTPTLASTTRPKRVVSAAGFGIRAPERVAKTEARTRLTTTTIITAFTVDVVKRPISSPTNVAASVAAAWATDRPKTTPTSALV